MPVITDFGDAAVQGNVTVAGNLASLGTFMAVTGNIWTSSASRTVGNVNRIWGNLFALNMNVTTLNTATLIVSSGVQLNNLVVANSVSTTNVVANVVNSTSMNTFTHWGLSNLGVGTTPVVRGATVFVQGNVYVANGLSTSNIITTNVNAATLNTTTVSTALLTSLNFSTGNILISNTLTCTNVLATNVLATTIYTASQVGALSYINLNPMNVIATGNIFYADNASLRVPYLRASPSNAAVIQAWIAGTCAAASTPTDSWWATSPSPVYGVGAGPAGSGNFLNSLLLPDGRVLFAPGYSANVSIFNTFSGTLSLVPLTGAFTNGSEAFSSAVLAPNGNVVCVPYNSGNAVVFNPISYTASNITGVRAGAGLFGGSVMAPNGNVVCVPSGSDNVCEISILSNPPVFSNMLSIAAVSSLKWQGGVLLPNGNVVFVPRNASNVVTYNPLSNPPTFSNIIASPGFIGGVLAPNGIVLMMGTGNVGIFNPSLSTFSNIVTGGTGVYRGGVLLPTGNVVCIPETNANIGMVDPVALTHSNIVCGYTSGLDTFNGGTLLPDGRVVMCPYVSGNVGILNTFTPAPREFCLSPYFNKY